MSGEGLSDLRSSLVSHKTYVAGVALLLLPIVFGVLAVRITFFGVLAVLTFWVFLIYVILQIIVKYKLDRRKSLAVVIQDSI
jgi:hypothetical protein